MREPRFSRRTRTSCASVQRRHRPIRRVTCWPDSFERLLSCMPRLMASRDLRLDFERPLWILAAVVGLVLLIACSNVANLLTARAAARDREMALRLSIGAGRGRLVQQLLIESALMSAAACVLGLMFAAVAAPAIVRMLAPGDAPVYLELEASWRLMAFTSLTVTATSLLFGLAPALRASAAAPIGVLKAVGGRVIGRVASLRPLVAAQVGFSLVVVFLASLLVASFVRLMTTDMGFTKTGVTLFNIWSDELGERERKDLIAMNALAWQTLERIRQVSGVKDASLSFWGLFEGSAWSTLVKIPGREQDSTEVYYLEVSPGFMRTMGIRLLNGRDFVFGDIVRYTAAPHGPVPVIVNDAFAQRFFSERPAVGRRFDRVVGRGPAEPQDIVGIVANAKYRDVRESNLPTVYLPSRGLNGKTLEVRSTADPEALARRVRLELSRIDPAIKVTNVIQQSTLVDNTLLRERLLALLSAFFGAVSIVLALIGMYGVLTYTVVQRTREIGIRMALGARQGSVVRSVLGDVVWTTGVGLIAGLACGLALARFVRALLFEVTPFDVMSITLPIAMLLVAAVIAAIPPARRAVRNRSHRSASLRVGARQGARAPCRNARVVTCRSFPAWSTFFAAAASTTTSTTNCAFISSSGRKPSSPAEWIRRRPRHRRDAGSGTACQSRSAAVT